MAWNNHSKWECGSIPDRSVNPNQQPDCIRVSYYDYCGHSPYRNLEDKNKSDISHLLANTLPLHYYSWDKSLWWEPESLYITTFMCHWLNIKILLSVYSETLYCILGWKLCHFHISLPKHKAYKVCYSHGFTLKTQHSKHIQMYKARHKQNSLGPSHTGQDTD